MGILAPLIKKSQTGPHCSPEEMSSKVLTLPTVVSLGRIGLACHLTKELMTNEEISPWSLFFESSLLASSDSLDGQSARLIDRLFPDSGRGTTKWGATIDVVSDTSALIIVGAGAVLSPKINWTAKAAIGLTLGHEITKAVWATNKGRQYKALTGDILNIKPTNEGKESMAEKYLGVILLMNTASQEKNRSLRTLLTIGGLLFSASGTVRSEKQRQMYNQIASQKIENAKNT